MNMSFEIWRGCQFLWLGVTSQSALLTDKTLHHLLHFAKLLGVMAPSITSMGLCHPNPPPRQMLHTELWQHFWAVRRFKCISELIFVTTKLPASLLGSSPVYVTKCWRAWKWRNWITAVEQSLAFWRPHICMLMLSYAHIQWHCLTISRYWASSVSLLRYYDRTSTHLHGSVLSLPVSE